MKTIIACTIRMCIAKVALVLALFGAGASAEYELRATVVDVDVDDAIVYVEDTDGQIWSFYGDGYSVEDHVILIMDDNGTSTIYDDIVTDAIILIE